MREFGRQHVGRADEIGDEAGARPLIDLFRRADLDDPAVVEDGDAVGHRQGLALVMGDEDEGDAEIALQGLELDLHLLAQLEIERAQRLVEQQHLRLVDQRAGKRHALALAAGKLRGPPCVEALERDQIQRLARLALRGRRAPRP